MGVQTPFYIKELSPQYPCSGPCSFGEIQCSATGTWIQRSRFNPNLRVLHPILFSLSGHKIIQPGCRLDDGKKLAGPLRKTKKFLMLPALILSEMNVRKLWNRWCKSSLQTIRILIAAGFHLNQEINFLKEPMNLIKSLPFVNLPKVPSNSGGIFDLPDQRKN